MKNMINRAILMATVVFMTMGLAYAMPVVSNVEMVQREASHIVDITYDLTGEAAIVTVGIETNGVPIPDSAVTRLSGDVSTVIQPGMGKTIVWNAGVDWPENLTEVAKAKVTAWSTNAPPQVMVIDLSKGIAATETDPYPVYYYNSLDVLPGGGLSNALYKTDMLVMNKIPSGSYAMGDETTSGSSVAVTLTQDFYVGVYQVTQEQWYKVTGKETASFKNPFNPVQMVTYFQIRENPDNSPLTQNWPESNTVGPDSFMGKLGSKTGLAGFDLPTEAQWEYACRAGTTTYYNDGIEGASNDQLDELGWWSGNSGSLEYPDGSTHPVGQKTPNAWGLYDMHGNVWEWCLDRRGDLVAGINPKGAEEGADPRVIRGGAWSYVAHSCRSASRNSTAPSFLNILIGFRLVRTLP